MKLLWPIMLLAVAALWRLAYAVNRRRVRAHDGTGDPADGLVIFVEPVRWLFIVWGFVGFCRGLRRAGLQPHVRLFRWSGRAGALLVLPDFVRRRRLRRKATRLARFTANLAAQHPGRPIHLVAYSTGCFIALEALQHLDPRVSVGQVILLAGAVSPGYDLHAVSGRVAGLHNFYSFLDFLISGFAPLAFGSNDGPHRPGCGMVGFRPGPAGLIQHSWRPFRLALGYLGDHFTIASARFIAADVATLLAPRPETAARRPVPAGVGVS
jgi:hypothetical protein